MKIRKLVQTAACVAAIATLGLQACHASTLDDIRKNKKIRIAIAMGVPLFSYADANLKPTGSDVDTAQLLAHDLGVEAELVLITNAARVPTIQSGKADIAVANLSITPEREKVIDFSAPYAKLMTIVAAPKGQNIKSYADLSGKRIGVTRATVNDSLITQNAKGADILRFEDDATLITSVVSGQVDIISTQPPLVASINAKTPNNPLETKFLMKEFDLGIAIPKNEPKLVEWINGWIKANLKNGKLNAIYKKYHGVDLPASMMASAS
jgi:polar amino acid transport system substrate-binding protein